MSITWSRPTVAAAVLTAAVLIPAGAAHAHHPVVAGQATCADGRYSITWTVTADAVRGKEWRLTVPQVTGWQADRLPFTLTTTAAGDARSASLTVVASWRPEGPVNEQRTGTVQLAGSCVPATTTTVPPTTVPSTTVAPTTTAPATTVPSTTVPATTVPEVTTTVPVDTTTPAPPTTPETAPPPVSVPPTLPETGVEPGTLGLAALALVFILAGVALIRRARS